MGAVPECCLLVPLVDHRRNRRSLIILAISCKYYSALCHNVIWRRSDVYMSGRLIVIRGRLLVPVLSPFGARSFHEYCRLSFRMTSKARKGSISKSHPPQSTRRRTGWRTSP